MGRCSGGSSCPTPNASNAVRQRAVRRASRGLKASSGTQKRLTVPPGSARTCLKASKAAQTGIAHMCWAWAALGLGVPRCGSEPPRGAQRRSGRASSFGRA
eukprot:11309821-Alexandrium_andersonii.AAC.1